MAIDSVDYSNSVDLRWDNDLEVWIILTTFTAHWCDIFVTVPKGFETDLASIPRIFRSLIPQVGHHLQAAIVHDLCYSGIGISRKRSDKMFLVGMKTSGVNWLKRTLIYSAVRTGGWAFFRGQP